MVARSLWSGEGVFGMLVGGKDELLVFRLGGLVGWDSAVASSGGVSKASGRRDEIPNVLKHGSWKFGRDFARIVCRDCNPISLTSSLRPACGGAGGP